MPSLYGDTHADLKNVQTTSTDRLYNPQNGRAASGYRAIPVRANEAFQSGRITQQIEQIKLKNGENLNTITGEPRSQSGLAITSSMPAPNSIGVAKGLGRDSKSVSNMSANNISVNNHVSASKSPLRHKKEIAVWDAIVLADQERYRREQQ